VRHKRVWASLRQTPVEVIDERFAETERRDPKHDSAWSVLVDGQEARNSGKSERRWRATERTW
jgi:hypothetical protein